MFAKLKKKIADEAGSTSRPGMGRIPRSVSRDSITSVGADSGDDIASDSSCSREDLLSQLLRRNDQVRKLEVKLSDYAEQLRNLQKTKEKLEIALEKHQDSSMRKLQEQNEAYQANRAKMAEGMALALEKKDQEKAVLENQLKQMKDHSLNLFQKRDEQDELDGFQQQELAKVKHMLLRKEEMLSNFERELEERKTELDQTKEELKVSNQKLLNQDNMVKQLQTLNTDINKEREKFVATQRSAEEKITVLENRAQELQNVIQRLSVDLHKTSAETEEKGKIIKHLQAKVFSLEKRLEGNYSEDEHVQELLKEKFYLEQKLEETRHLLLEAKTSHTEAVSVFETQIAKLNNDVIEIQTSMKEKDNEMQAVKDENARQVSELEQRLHFTEGMLTQKGSDVNEKEVQIKKLQEESEAENDRLQHQIAALKHQHTEKSNRVDAQIAALETAREFDKTASQHKISQFQQKNEDLSDRLNETENALRKVECELERSKEELNSRETVSVEIAKALEEARKQKEELQHKVLKLTDTVDEKNTSVLQKDKELIKMQEDFRKLEQDHESVVSQMHQLQMENETSKSSLAEREGAVQSQLNDLKLQLAERQELLEASQRKEKDLEAEVTTLNGQLHPSENEEKGQNGDVTIADALQLQHDNQDLEQQLMEKNKTIKQLLQRLTELKKTLQKELKMKPELETAEVREKSFFELPASINNSTTVVNNSDLNDSREINFEYLKHVLLKFMSVRESEAYQLVKAVSMLLNFTREEENLLKESLEYKMSWFGSKPTPKGTIRPSITSRPPPHWQ
ncbi:golgin subfamily A member 1 isoform X2 [Mustelus asterias]